MRTAEPGQWLTVGRTYDEQRFSPLAQINAGQRGQLGLAWYADLDTNRGQEASPLVIDGVLYVTSAWSKVFAFNAQTGKLLWKYDPQVAGSIGIKGCCDVVNRGVAAWKGRIYLGAYDGRLIALDAKTGKVAWSVQSPSIRRKAYTSTGAPRIANGKVIIGNAGSEIGVRGYISAYDAATASCCGASTPFPAIRRKPYENEQLRAGRGDVDRRPVLETGRRPRYGTASSTSRKPTWCISAPPTARPGWPRRAARRAATICSQQHHRGGCRHRPLRLALPGDARGDLGLRRHQSAGAGGPRHRRRHAARADAGVEERLLLRARCGHRQAAARRRTTRP